MGILSSATHVKMCQMLPFFLLPAALYRITDQCSRDNFQTTKKKKEQKSTQNSLKKFPPPPPPKKKPTHNTTTTKKKKIHKRGKTRGVNSLRLTSHVERGTQQRPELPAGTVILKQHAVISIFVILALHPLLPHTPVVTGVSFGSQFSLSAQFITKT